METDKQTCGLIETHGLCNLVASSSRTLYIHSTKTVVTIMQHTPSGGT